MKEGLFPVTILPCHINEKFSLEIVQTSPVTSHCRDMAWLASVLWDDEHNDIDSVISIKVEAFREALSQSENSSQE